MAPNCSCDYAPTLTLSREALWRRSLHWLALNHDEKNQIHWPGLLLNASAGGGSCENMPAWIRKLTQTSLAGPLLRPKAQGSLSGNCSRISIDELDPCPEGACHVRLSQNKKKLNMSQVFPTTVWIVGKSLDIPILSHLSRYLYKAQTRGLSTRGWF